MALRADLDDEVEDLAMVTSVLAVVHIRDNICPIPTQVKYYCRMRPIIRDDVLYLGVVIIYKAGFCVYSTCPALCLKVNINSSHHPYSHRTIPSSPGESSDTESAEEEETEDMEGLLGSRFNDCS